jgi:uncharacterized paraquat-inducible protein A
MSEDDNDTSGTERCKNCQSARDVSGYGYCSDCRSRGYGRGDHRPATSWARTAQTDTNQGGQTDE